MSAPLTRRLFARQAAVAPLAAEALLQSRAAGGHLYGGDIAGGSPIAQSAGGGLIDKAWKLLRGTRKALDAKERRNGIFNGMDPDILALRSVSPSYKARMLAASREKLDRESESIWKAARRAVGLPEED